MPSLFDILLVREADKRISHGKDINLPLSGSHNPAHRELARRQEGERRFQEQMRRRKEAKPAEDQSLLGRAKAIKRKINPLDRLADVLGAGGN